MNNKRKHKAIYKQFSEHLKLGGKIKNNATGNIYGDEILKLGEDFRFYGCWSLIDMEGKALDKIKF